MKPFTTHTGVLATLNRANVDTDAIIPKQFLKSIKRTGYGPQAFFDWRYTADGVINPDFELNDSRFEERSILIARNNFGCGSSREHAVWALVQDGYRVIVAPTKCVGEKRLPGFADIFKANAAKNGLLVFELSEEEVDKIFSLVKMASGLCATVDLTNQQLTIHAEQPLVFSFDIDPGTKDQLIKGLDDIDRTLAYETDIAAFEASHKHWRR